MLAFIAALVLTAQAASQKSALDFWVGSWDVYSGKDLDGHDMVEKSLDGNAITERWKGVSPGDEGMSLFYYRPFLGSWKQVWVTPVGMYKEKESELVPGGIRFTGKAFGPKGRTIDDRTTLTLNPDGTVRQVIERSKDGGKTWEVGYDAIYRRSKG
ncbi:MAG: hypothetical protein JSS72_07345 [Armatimonadetes bacterium]|nr:hypothetical protein [Armatimonadota bacterium]